MPIDLDSPARAIPTGRLAPSPTGGLHLGHARTFLAAWASARSRGGRMVYRVEDLDASRARDESVAGAMADLAWLGLDWDDGPDLGGPDAPYVQSERMTLYARHLDLLKSSEQVYPCTCTRAEIERAASAPHAEDEGPTYPGTCSGRSSRDAERLEAEGRRFAWRFRVPDAPISWIDRHLGPTEINPAKVGGDFVVARSGGTFSYQLAVVVDDAAMGVTEVVRGDDLVPSTPRQVHLYRSLGFPPPTFAHLPMAVGPDGRRLAKREGANKLSAFRKAGADPARMIAVLARSLGWPEGFRLDRVGDEPDRLGLLGIPREPWVVSDEVVADLMGRAG